jgi:hypothetical protein
MLTVAAVARIKAAAPAADAIVLNVPMTPMNPKRVL